MNNQTLNNHSLYSFDDRRNIALKSTKEEALDYAARHWIGAAKKAIEEKGLFTAALSGGSTPKALYQKLLSFKNDLDWSRVELYFSDERCVSLDSPESNFKMAWESAFKELINRDQIHPMYEGGDPEESAKSYEALLPKAPFDLVMLGVGQDGHIASLFPHTHALSSRERRVVANFLPEKETWRLTLTFDEINRSPHAALYVFGSDKASIINKIFTDAYDPEELPAQKIGTATHPALWILDSDSSALLQQNL